ncbi:MAG: DUF1501 domain-containing protein, partial [Planctomycetota bacterium]|nr:DUF1501 domain-containing protein [Planctomycetota bacterium]
MNIATNQFRLPTRRAFLQSSGLGLGTAALTTLLAAERTTNGTTTGIGTDQAVEVPRTVPRAKRVIYLFQSGAPSQIDLFDPKPQMRNRMGEDLPDSIRRGQRLTGMTSTQSRFPIAPTIFDFARHGQSGAWVSNLLPHTARMVDQLCFVRSMHTEAINHDPAITFFQTGAQLAG